MKKYKSDRNKITYKIGIRIMDIGIIFVRDLKLTSAKDPEDPQSLDKICKGLLKQN